jgi:hypothetical protein
MISVISVDFHSGVFRDILVDSLKQNADPNGSEYEILIHDNGKGNNVGHARGVHKLIHKAKYNTILLLDIDAHIMMKDWNRRVSELKKSAWERGVRLIAGEGGKLKPVRPCVMLFERDYFLENSDFTFESQKFLGAKFDVGVLFAFQVLSLGDKVEFFPYAKKTYPDTIGNDYRWPGGKELFAYHHWYGTRWYDGNGKRVRDKVDSLTWKKFEASRDQLEKQYKLLNTSVL